MRTLRLLPLLLLLASTLLAQQQPSLAPTPPMGWNSWDSYGTTVNEQQVRENAAWMKQHLAPFGWSYIVVDMEWFVQNPTPEGNSPKAIRTLDAFGRYIPAPARFPSAAGGKGFAPLAAYVHSLGLKFGIHILQGIPRESLASNPLIEGSSFHVRDAANPAAPCAWNPGNFDLLPTPSGQAYYDSIARLYASWGVDLVKVDCITAPQLKSAEISMLRKALDQAATPGHPISISLSPGEPPIEQVADLQFNAQQWRISNDIWDLWHNDHPYPQGLGDQFARVAYWNRTRLPGHWPDADMLPIGHLGPAPGWGQPRDTRLTHPEQRTLLTLWSIFRSPLMMGGNLPQTDAWTESLLTNPDVLGVDQHSNANRLALQRLDSTVWTAQSADSHSTYLAIFNQTNQPLTFRAPWSELGLTAATYALKDLWTHTQLPPQSTLTITLEPHGSALLRATPEK